VLNNIQSELRELLDLVRQAENFDATLAANPTIQPTQAAVEERKRKGLYIARLKEKYDL
jgi:hypothetical protein